MKMQPLGARALDLESSRPHTPVPVLLLPDPVISGSSPCLIQMGEGPTLRSCEHAMHWS